MVGATQTATISERTAPAAKCEELLETIRAGVTPPARHRG